MINKINELLAEIEAFAPQTAADVEAFRIKILGKKGTLGALMYDRSLYNSLNKTVGSMDSLMTDIKSHPKRYVHFSVFGKKDK